jgi:hypothetical protein
MSIGANALSEVPICADPAPANSTTKPPRHRIISAKADQLLQPEAR